MRLTYFAIAALPGALASITRLAPRCNADNCARAVTGTKAQPALSVRQSDCSNFQTATVYPPAETTTIYDASSDATVFPTGTTDMTVQATEVPSYASAPCGTTSPAVSSRYASACSCFGFPATATTAPAETVTVSTTGPVPTSLCAGAGPGDECTSASGAIGACQYDVDTDSNLVCAIYNCPNEDLCRSATDCASGQRCVNAGALCSTNSCEDLVE